MEILLSALIEPQIQISLNIFLSVFSFIYFIHNISPITIALFHIHIVSIINIHVFIFQQHILSF